jgi:hypothetical protein
MMSISAFEFNRGRWHNGQFLILITRSKVSEEDACAEVASSSSDDEVESCLALLDLGPPGVDAVDEGSGTQTLNNGLSLDSVTNTDLPKSVGDSSPKIALKGGPEKSSPPKKGRPNARFNPISSPGVMDSDADALLSLSMKVSIISILFFSHAGRMSSVSRH